MDLKSFVAQTLSEILSGIVEAQSQRSDGGRINPKYANSPVRPEECIVIEFDVAVTAETHTQGNSADPRRGTIEVLSAAIGAKFTSGEKNATVSRVKFSVKVQPPFQDIPQTQRAAKHENNDWKTT